MQTVSTASPEILFADHAVFGDGWAHVAQKTEAMRQEGAQLLAALDVTTQPAPLVEAHSTLARTTSELVPLIRRELSVGAESYRTAGALLLEAKAALPHGRFKAWIADNFTLSYSSAKAYMRLAASKGQTSSLLATGDPSTRRNARRAVPAPSSDATTPERAALAVEMLNLGFKQLAMKTHPDVGGSHEQMAAMAAARDWAIRVIEGR
jgi:Protein of unknown function (DUF3102)